MDTPEELKKGIELHEKLDAIEEVAKLYSDAAKRELIVMILVAIVLFLGTVVFVQHLELKRLSTVVVTVDK